MEYTNAEQGGEERDTEPAQRRRYLYALAEVAGDTFVPSGSGYARAYVHSLVGMH